MKEYILSMVAVCIICIIVKEIFPDENSLKGHINLVCGLCILCVMIYPVCNLIRFVSEFDFSSIVTPDTEYGEKYEYESVFDNYLCNMQLESIKSEIKNCLKDTCGLHDEDMEIYLYTENENGKLYIKRVTVSLFGRGVFCDSNKIKTEVQRLCSCEVAVTVG